MKLSGCCTTEKSKGVHKFKCQNLWLFVASDGVRTISIYVDTYLYKSIYIYVARLRFKVA